MACSPNVKTVPTNLDAEKAAVKDLYDRYMAAFIAGDAVTLASFLTEDALLIGSDPHEFFDKKYIVTAWNDTFENGIPELRVTGDPVIKLSPDGMSGILVHQFEMPDFLPGILWRQAFSVAKADGTWKIFVSNVSLIPKNEDVPRIMEALQ